jgi:hypothetical protein
MNRAGSVALSMADKLFSGRRGHGSTETIVERHLRHGQVQEILKIAYGLGYEDGKKEIAVEKKPEGLSSPDRLTHVVVNELVSVLQDHGIKEADSLNVAEYVVKAMQNVTSVSDTTRLLDEIRRRRA